VKENEIKDGIGGEIEAETEGKVGVGEIINAEDNQRGFDDEIEDFLGGKKKRLKDEKIEK
jgi:hypothetical protein